MRTLGMLLAVGALTLVGGCDDGSTEARVGDAGAALDAALVDGGPTLDAASWEDAAPLADAGGAVDLGPPPLDTGPTPDAGEPVEGVEVAGRVVLPEGFALPPTSLRAWSAVDDGPVAATGDFTVVVPSEAPTLIGVADADGRLIAVGFAGVDAAPVEVGPASTAAWLLFVELGVFTLPADAWGEVLALVGAAPETGALADAIAAALVDDPGALVAGGEALRAALATAREALVPAAWRRDALKAIDAAPAPQPVEVPAQIGVVSENPQSGVHAGPAADDSGLVLTNFFRRHVWWFAYRVGYRDAAGDHRWPVEQWEPVGDGYLGSTNALSGLLGSAIDALWGNVAYAPVPSPVIAVPVQPDEATLTHYAVITAGGGLTLTLPEGLEDHADAEAWARAQTGMEALTFFKDFLVPTAFTFISPDLLSTFTGREITDVALDVVGLITQTGLDIVPALGQGDYVGATKSVVKALATDEVLQQRLATYLATHVLTRYTSAAVTARLARFATGLNGVLKGVDVAYFALDLGAVIKDRDDSNAYDRFDVVSLRTRVNAEPETQTLLAGTYAQVRATVEGIHGHDLIYLWWTDGDGAVGSLMEGFEPVNRVTGTEPRVWYRADDGARDGDVETVHVEVYDLVALGGGTEQVLVGQATATIEIEDTDEIRAETRYFPQIAFTHPARPNTYSYVSAVLHVWPRVPGATEYRMRLLTGGPVEDWFPRRVEDGEIIEATVRDQAYHTGGLGGLNLYGIGPDDLFWINLDWGIRDFPSQAEALRLWDENVAAWRRNAERAARMTLMVRPR